MKGYVMTKKGRRFEINLNKDDCYIVNALDNNFSIAFNKHFRFDQVLNWINDYVDKIELEEYKNLIDEKLNNIEEFFNSDYGKYLLRKD